MKQTPHIVPTADIAESILLPGDPLRAKFIADNFLTNAKQFNSVRNTLGFTGDYKGKPVSVMGTGMGMPSIGIYSYELISVFGVKNLIRIGSCGAIQENLKLYDIVVGMGASTNSNFAAQYNLPGTISSICSPELLKKTIETAEKLKINLNIGNILTSDAFYDDNGNSINLWRKMGVLAVEMEACALYLNAARLRANALCILTVSDHILTKEETTAVQREKSFKEMMELSLETIISL